MDLIQNFGTTILEKRKILKISRDKMAKDLGISVSSIRFYERGERAPNFVIHNAIQKYLNVEEDFDVNVKEPNVDYERKYITSLESQNDLLKDKVALLENQDEVKKRNTLWSDLTTDFECTVKLGLTTKGFKRTITEVNNIDSLAQKLAVDKNELLQYYAIGETFLLEDHPVDQIIDKNSLHSMRSHTNSFRQSLQFMREFMGDFFIPVNITYKLNGKSVDTVAFNKVNLFSMEVRSKNTFSV